MMYQKLIVPVDHGNQNIKGENVVFTSGLVESDCKPMLGDYLYYKNRYYSLTDQRIPYMRDKTGDERFFILTLFAIAIEAERQGAMSENNVLHVSLPVGLPPKHFGTLYQKFQDYFSGRGAQHFTYKGKHYEVHIEDVVAYPQDYAAAMTIYPKLKEYNRVVIADLGGFTFDYLLLRNGNPDLSVCDSLEKGIITLHNKIISRINSEYDVLLEGADIDCIIKNGKTDYEENVVRTVREMSRTYVDDLLGDLRERGIDLKSVCIVFIGGGSILLKEYFENSGKVGRCIFVEDVCANAKGYKILYGIQQRGR